MLVFARRRLSSSQLFQGEPSMLALLAVSAVLAAPPMPGNAAGNVIVSCDCTGVIVYLDGKASAPVPQQQVNLMGVPPGRHAMKVEAWLNAFQSATWFNGMVDLPPGTELRGMVKQGRFDVYSTVSLMPA